MQAKEINVLKQQATALGQFLSGHAATTLNEATLLEALAVMHGADTWEALCARKAKRASKADKRVSACSVDELIKFAIAKGATFGDFSRHVTREQSDLEAAYANYARDELQSDGELEFDDGCVVSVSEDGGAYVQGWAWVNRSDIEDYYEGSDDEDDENDEDSDD